MAPRDLSPSRPRRDRTCSAWLVAGALWLPGGFAVPAACVVGVLGSEARASPGRATSVEALARRLQQWVADPDPRANARAVDRVALGVPPGAMVAFLVAVREHPRALFAATVRDATRYRSLGVRGHALAASAALGPQSAQDAIARAADDPERGIRRLALALATRHPSPAAQETVVRLLARDTELAQEQAAPPGLVPDGPEAPPEEVADPFATPTEAQLEAQEDADLIVIEEDEA